MNWVIEKFSNEEYEQYQRDLKEYKTYKYMHMRRIIEHSLIICILPCIAILNQHYLKDNNFIYTLLLIAFSFNIVALSVSIIGYCECKKIEKINILEDIREWDSLFIVDCVHNRIDNNITITYTLYDNDELEYTYKLNNTDFCCLGDYNDYRRLNINLPKRTISFEK